MSRNKKHVFSIVVMAMFLVVGVASLDSGPNPKVESTDLSARVYSDYKDDPDAGFRATMIINNRGGAGNVIVVAQLFCSEGDYTREEEVYLEKDEVKQLYFDFPEPTIFATDVKWYYQVKNADDN